MIKNNLPGFICAIPEMDMLISAEQPELTEIASGMELYRKGFLLENGSMLPYYEELFGFSGSREMSTEERLERVRARMIFSAPMTKRRIEEMLTGIGMTPVTVTEDPDGCTMTIKFTGTVGVPKYLNDIKKEVELIRPFHIVPIYEYLFTTLGEYGGVQLGEIGEMTLLEMAENGT